MKDSELNIKLNLLDEVKSMIKDHILEVEHATNRDNYSSMVCKKMGMQIILCAVADMQFELGKEAKKHDI